jgi:hypothetical protein
MARMISKAALLVALFVLLAVGAHTWMLVAAAHRAAHMVGPHLENRTAILFRADDSFSARERILMMEAAEAIAKASGCVKLTLVFGNIPLGEAMTWRSDNSATIYRASNPLTWKRKVADHLAGPGSYMGLAMITTGDIFIMASAAGNETDFRNTVAHEMLHVVFESGWHSKDPDSLMYRAIGEGTQRLLDEERGKLREMCGN